MTAPTSFKALLCLYLNSDNEPWNEACSFFFLSVICRKTQQKNIIFLFSSLCFFLPGASPSCPCCPPAAANREIFWCENKTKKRVKNKLNRVSQTKNLGFYEVRHRRSIVKTLGNIFDINRPELLHFNCVPVSFSLKISGFFFLHIPFFSLAGKHLNSF